MSRPSRGSDHESWRKTTRSLGNRNFRRYVIGQGVSHTGTWLQQTAELWVILQLTHDATALGLHSALRFGPVLILGAYGGLVSDRFDRRTLLIATQTLHAVAAVVLAAAALTGSLNLPIIYGTVLMQGVVNAIDNPLRRGFVRDLVSDDDLANAVSMHSVTTTVTRAVGPALAGVCIATAGVEWCFAANALSFLAVLASLFTIDPRLLRPATPMSRSSGQLRDGFHYAWRNAEIRRTLLITAVVSTFAWNWTVILPVYATVDLGGGASLYGNLVALLSVGSFAGAVGSARVSQGTGLHVHTCVLVVALALTAAAPSLLFALAGVFLLGAAGTSFTIAAQTRLQLGVADAMSGRVMALYSVGFVGSKPLGGIVGGWVTDASGARGAFAVGAAVVGILVLAGQGKSP